MVWKYQQCVCVALFVHCLPYSWIPKEHPPMLLHPKSAHHKQQQQPTSNKQQPTTVPRIPNDSISYSLSISLMNVTFLITVKGTPFSKLQKSSLLNISFWQEKVRVIEPYSSSITSIILQFVQGPSIRKNVTRHHVVLNFGQALNISSLPIPPNHNEGYINAYMLMIASLGHVCFRGEKTSASGGGYLAKNSPLSTASVWAMSRAIAVHLPNTCWKPAPSMSGGPITTAWAMVSKGTVRI